MLAGLPTDSRCGRGRLRRSKPPSSSGLGHRPFKAAARVRIPLGVRHYSKAQWRSWLARRPVTAKVAGSSPVWVAPSPVLGVGARPGSSVGTSVRLKSGRSAVRPRPWPPLLTSGNAVRAHCSLSARLSFCLIRAPQEPVQPAGDVVAERRRDVRPAVRLGQHPAPVLPQAAGMLVFAVLRVPVLVRVASWVGRTSRLRRSHRSRTPPPARGRPAGPPHRPSAGEEARSPSSRKRQSAPHWSPSHIASGQARGGAVSCVRGTG